MLLCFFFIDFQEKIKLNVLLEKNNAIANILTN